MNADPKWRSVWGHVKRRGKFVNLYVEVTKANGVKIFRSVTVPVRSLEGANKDLYAHILNTLVKELDQQLSGRA